MSSSGQSLVLSHTESLASNGTYVWRNGVSSLNALFSDLYDVPTRNSTRP